MKKSITTTLTALGILLTSLQAALPPLQPLAPAPTPSSQPTQQVASATSQPQQATPVPAAQTSDALNPFKIAADAFTKDIKPPLQPGNYVIGYNKQLRCYVLITDYTNKTGLFYLQQNAQGIWNVSQSPSPVTISTEVQTHMFTVKAK